jgi:hypothetical protein
VLVLPVSVVAFVLAGSASGDPSFPPVPPINVHLPAPQQKAVFDVVVEGDATDKLVSQLSGDSGFCLFTEDATVNEDLKYQRGKGVKVEFDRYGHEALVHRKGRKTDSSLAVKLTQTKTATGGSQGSPSHPPLPCSVPPEDLAQNGECGQPLHDDGKMLLSYEGGGLKLSVGSSKAISVVFEENKCGEDKQTGITDDSGMGWPTMPPLERAPLPIGQIFGHRHVIVLKLRSSDVGKPRVERRQIQGPFKGDQVETAFNKATVRLIRRGG